MILKKRKCYTSKAETVHIPLTARVVVKTVVQYTISGIISYTTRAEICDEAAGLIFVQSFRHCYRKSVFFPRSRVPFHRAAFETKKETHSINVKLVAFRFSILKFNLNVKKQSEKISVCVHLKKSCMAVYIARYRTNSMTANLLYILYILAICRY